MRIKYYTKHGSVYIHTLEGGRDYWIKEDAGGGIHPLVAALHISKARLQELVREYPATLLDKTYCFDMGVEKEFFDDARRESFDAFFETEETVIFFLVKHSDEHYTIGCSTQVIKVDKID